MKKKPAEPIPCSCPFKKENEGKCHEGCLMYKSYLRRQAPAK